jgi:hypothetical protein
MNYNDKQKTVKQITHWIRSNTDHSDRSWVFATLNSKAKTSEKELEGAINHLLNLLDVAAYGRKKNGYPKKRLERIAILEGKPKNPHIHMIIATGGKISSVDQLIYFMSDIWKPKPGPMKCCGKHGKIEKYLSELGGVEYLAEKLALQTRSHKPDLYLNLEGFNYENA